MKRRLFFGLALAVALLIGVAALAEQNDITISPGKEGLPSSSAGAGAVKTLEGYCGRTTPGATNWVQYNSDTVYVDVNTSAAGFSSTPAYITSLGGSSNHWNTAGATSIYIPTATGFRVYVRFLGGSITPTTANSYQWHINWCGFPISGGGDPTPTGDISFSLTWTYTGSSRSEGPDIDMWVTDPNGYRLSTSRDGYSLGPTPNGGVIDHDDLGGWGDGDGGGPERAYWPTGQASRGTYTFGVRYYQGDGTAYYSLKVYFGTTLYYTYTGTLTSPGSAITVGSVSY